MSLEQEVLAWATTRPAWQQEVLARLLRGDALADGDCRQIAADLAAPPCAQSPVALAVVSAQSGRASRVQLESLRVLAHVNRLVPRQTLTFGNSGLTVIFGDNASGKSGYARLIKTVARARHLEPILTNIFADGTGASPEAQIVFSVDGTVSEITWPHEPSPELARVSFYDRACGDAYISTESEVTYRPSVLVLLDRLIRVCDNVRDCLDDLLAANAAKRIDLPKVADPGLAIFMANLSGNTALTDVGAACAQPAEIEKDIASLMADEYRLLESDPQKERDRLETLARRLDTIAGHIADLSRLLGTEAEQRLRDQMAAVAEAVSVAEAAAQPSFETDPLKGTGSPLWRAMWDAAKRFSEGAGYVGERFPVGRPGAHCPLCQQDLSREAAHRFERFAAILADETRAEADRAQMELVVVYDGITAATTLPAHIAATLAQVEVDEPALVAMTNECIATFGRRREELLRLSSEDPGAIGQVPILPELATRAGSVRAIGGSLDAAEFQRRLAHVRERRTELESRRTLAAARDDIEAEVSRRRDRISLEEAKRTTDTTHITRKSTELARSYVTNVVLDRFTRESDRLRLEGVTLQDAGGHKGQLHQRPTFLAAKQRAEMRQVLSDGEQTALGLAGFFTEAELDESRSALVFDDPVSSLSHSRRGKVAERIAQLAKDRQVIVFTHELTFAGELRVAADREDVLVTERQIERRGVNPGVCLAGHPWKAKNAKSRIGELEAALQGIKGDATSWTQDEYDTRVADWSGRLSETWERILSEEITDQIVDPSTLEVRPKMIKLLVRITEGDAKEFEESYSRVSRWVRRHDKDRELNYVAPDLMELEREIALVRGWFERVRKYKN